MQVPLTSILDVEKSYQWAMLQAQGHLASLWRNKELKSRLTIPEIILPLCQTSVTFHSYKNPEHNNEGHTSTAYLMHMTGMVSSSHKHIEVNSGNINAMLHLAQNVNKHILCLKSHYFISNALSFFSILYSYVR